MKLDYDLVRTMLLQIEEDVDGVIGHSIGSYCKEAFSNNAHEQTKYHMKYLIDAGMIQATNGYFNDLTPAGHKFLADIRSETVWTKTKELSTKLGAGSISALSSIAGKVIAETIKNSFSF